MSRGLLAESKSSHTELLGTLVTKDTIRRSQINGFSWSCLIDQVWVDDFTGRMCCKTVKFKRLGVISWEGLSGSGLQLSVVIGSENVIFRPRSSFLQ